MRNAVAQVADGDGGPTPYPVGGANSHLLRALENLTEVDPEFPHPRQEPAGVKNPEIQKLNVALKKSKNDNKFLFKAAEATALGAFQAAWFVWQQASADYEAAVESAEADLQSTANAAVETYTDKWSEDSPVQDAILYAQLQSNVAGGLATYQAAAGTTAGATLAAAAGAMLTAYATLVSAAQAAEVTLLTNDITAESTYWEGVQNLRTT
jgi:hypothetical protein